MFEAEIAGKLPELAAYEDYLTSCIFGALKYLPPRSGLLPLLRASTNYALDSSLGDSLDRSGILSKDLKTAQLLFWPRSARYGEPDLVVILKGESGSFIIPIEIKFFSAKHGEEEDDQLMRYYQALATAEGRKTFTCEAIRRFAGEFLGLIYVTQFQAEHEIEVTLRQLDHRGMGHARDKIFHLKWQQVHSLVEKLWDAEEDPYRKKLLLDTKRLLEHKRLTPFTGFSRLGPDLSAKELLHVPVFLACEEVYAQGFSHFPALPDTLRPQVLRTRPVFLQERDQP